MKQCACILVFIWIISLLLSSVKLFNFHTMVSENTTTIICSPMDPLINKIETIFLFVTQFLIPVVIISYTYFRIVHHMYFNECPNSSTKNQKTNKKKVILQTKYCQPLHRIPNIEQMNIFSKNLLIFSFIPV